MDFVKGLELNRGFYFEIVKPLLDKSFKGLRYTAALLGYGSDVLGMDTEQSMDHNWGPRMQIFIDDPELTPVLNEFFKRELPLEYSGFSVNFSSPRYDNTQSMQKLEKRPENNLIEHLIEVDSFRSYLSQRYSINKTSNFSLNDWLMFTDQNLLEITSGDVFHDGLNMLNNTRRELEFYPSDICKLRMAVLWHYISNKEAFIGRSIALDDFTGLKIMAAQLVNYLIKILFYLERKYIPYSKWFGSFFKTLDVYSKVENLVRGILSENDPSEIERKLCLLYVFVVERHNATPGMPYLNNAIQDFFQRPYKVIFAETIIEVLKKSILDDEIRSTDLRKYAHDIIIDE